MKKILIIGYSQSGQLHEILDGFQSALGEYDVDRIAVQTLKKFEFPWDNSVFFETMPATVLEKNVGIEPLTFKHNKYDLLIIGHQPWFLSPSLPTTALFKDQNFLNILKDTDVVSVVGARNMWINAQERFVQWIEDNNARLIAHIPFIDRNQNYLSALSILHWMLTGKKEKKWGILPKPGVSNKDINRSADFGELIKSRLEGKAFRLQTAIIETGFIELPASIMLIESRAKKIFRIWANKIESKSPEDKKKWISGFKYYLLVALFIVSPIVLVFYFLVVFPFTFRSVSKKRNALLNMGINNLS